MRRFLYDTAVFVYAFGREHSYRDPCRRIIALAGAGELRGEASPDLVQELLHQRARATGDRIRAAREAAAAAALCELHELRPDDVARAIAIFENSARLGAREAVFAAVALNRGIELVLSSDRAFDGVDELRRIDPADTSAVDSLLASPAGGS